MKKIIALTLIFVLLISCLGINTNAADFAGGGTKADPYIITNAQELDAVRNNLEAHYILNNDIDLTGVVFLPIGNNTTPFKGTFNGNGKKISGLTFNFEGNSYDVYVDEEKPSEDEDDGYTSGSDSGWTGDYEIGGSQPDTPTITETKIPKYIGLFGVNSGEIFDLHIEGANITVKALNGEIYVGVFCGLNKGQIYRSYSTLCTLSSFAVNDYCGGISGLNEKDATIGNCFSNAAITANLYGGGLSGKNNGYIACSYYNGFDIAAKYTDAICNNSGNAQYNYYLQGFVASSHATLLSASSFGNSSYFRGFNFSNVWRINSALKQPELRNNPYPAKNKGEVAAAPQLDSLIGNTVTLKTNGKTLFSNDGICWTENNVFTQEYGTTVNYYARAKESYATYLGAPSLPLEIKNVKSYDISNDGIVDNLDLTYLRRYLARWEITVNKDCLDVNNDTIIDNLDATYLARYLARWYD